MINFSILISNSEVNGPGGLFDINATLPLIIIQFILTAIALNPILFNPLVKVIDQRDNYVSNTVDMASRLLLEADILNEEYESKLENVKNETQLDITDSQEIYKEVFELILKISQAYIDDLLLDISNDLEIKREFASNNLNQIVELLHDDLLQKLITTRLSALDKL